MPKLGYVKEPGVINLSYSRSRVLHECPRKFQLREKYAAGNRVATVHTEFGHAYAAMVQEFFRTKDIDRSIVAGMAAWDMEDLFAEKPGKSVKCWEEVLIAFDCFVDNIYPADFEGKWELAQLDDHPAVELLFYIDIYGRYSYQGHIDLILQSVADNSLCVWEIKTTERIVHPAMYSNSAQATSYTVVCDELARKYNLHNKYQVGYIVYNPKQEENFGHTVYHFPKPPTTKIDAINTILSECTQIQQYEDMGFYPKNGDSCYNFYRACDLYGLCDLTVLQEDQDTAYENLTLDDVDLYIKIEDFLALTPEYGNQPQLIDVENL